MKITNIGGATAIVEHNNIRILFDPWLDDGIFSGSWYHFPPSKLTPSDLGHFDYIYISHIHEDHCSKGTIKYLNRDAEILLMNRDPNLVERFLEVNHFNFKKIHLISPFTPTIITPGLTVDMITADPSHKYNYYIDSAIVLKWDDFTLYNANDCAPYPDGLNYLKKNYPVIDLALIPYAGGSGYPACYLNLSHEQKISESQKIQKKCIDRFVQNFEMLRPDKIMPFADQYVIAGSRYALNEFLSHPVGPGSVFESMKKIGHENKLLLLNPDQIYDFETNLKWPNEEYAFPTEDDKKTYIENHLTKKKYEFELFELNKGIAIERLFKYARDRMWLEQTKQNYFPSFTYYFLINDRQRLFEIKLTGQEVKEISITEKQNENYLLLSCSFDLFVYLLLGHISWNIADAALFIDYERVPNIYDTKISAFVNFLRI